MNNSFKSQTGVSFDKELIHIPLIINELYILNTDTSQILVNERFNLNNSTPIRSENIPFLSFLKFKIENTKETLISYDSFYLNEKLIQILNVTQAKLSIIGYFKSNINLFFSKTLLLHILIAYINFQNKVEPKFMQSYQTVFAKCFCLPLINNFSEIFNIIMKKQELNLVNIKYKTFYFIDLSSNSILFNLNVFHNKKNIQIEKNEGIWKEILYHSHNLMMEYNTKNKKKYNAFYSSEYYVKLECRATFPRYILIIKFLPILHGISLVHVYIQKKLSHILEGNESEGKSYKEYNVIYGTEQKKSERHIEFKYVEPLKIKRIEQFFLNYFITTSPLLSFYYAEKYELKYLDSMLLRQISQIIKNEQNTQAALVQKIKSNFHKDLMNLKKKSFEESNKENDEELNVINFIDFLYFSKEKFLQNYNIPNNNMFILRQKNDDDNNIVLSENSKCKNGNDASLTFTCNIDDLVFSENKSNFKKTKSFFMMDITGIQKVNDEVTEVDISNIYPKKEIEVNEPYISRGRELLNNEKERIETKINEIKNKKTNWNVSGVPHDKELSLVNHN